MWSRSVCACVCLQLIAVVLAAPGPEALHYIGVGYNILRANPDGNFWAAGGDDPGLLSTRKILSLTGNGDVNNELVYEYHQTCRPANEFSFFYDPQSYQAKLMERIQTSGTNSTILDTYAFTLSEGYKSIEQQTQHDFYVFQDKQTTCTSGSARYKLGLSQGNHYGWLTNMKDNTKKKQQIKHA